MKKMRSSMAQWLLPLFLFSLVAPTPPGGAEIAHDVEKPAPQKTIYYPIKESCDKPATWGPAVSLHHRDAHAYSYYDEQSNTWRVKRPRPYGNVTYGTWWY